MSETKQIFKAIYFSDYKIVNPNSRGLVLAFGTKDQELYKKVSSLSSQEIRELLNNNSYISLEKQANRQGLPVSTFCLKQLNQATQQLKVQFKNEIAPVHTTFRGGRKNPLHSWYNYLEGYSPEYVEYIIDTFAPHANSVYDPFAGTGVTPLVAAKRGLVSYYSEVNPLLQFLVKTKITVSTIVENKRQQVITNLKRIQSDLSKLIKESEPDEQLAKTYLETFNKSRFFDEDTFGLILKARTLVDQLSYTHQLTADLLLVSILNSLIPSSFLERAGDLRFKTKKELKKQTQLVEQIHINLANIIDDISNLEPLPVTPTLITENSKLIGSVPNLQIDAVITSPPYLNGTNYFRNTKVELWFLRSIKNQNDLATFRKQTVTAGINDVSQKKDTNFVTPAIKKITEALSLKAYDQRIPKMVADYFQDMAAIFGNLKKHLKENSIVAIDLGDSIYGGIKVPTDELLIGVMEQLGYKFSKSLTLRKRISRNGEVLKQVLLVFHAPKKAVIQNNDNPTWIKNWNSFKKDMPHQAEPYSKRNWGHPLHSLCSYGGKMKPSLAYFLVKTFTKPGDKLLDPFAGVGTIPFEAALNGVSSYGFDISPSALIISKAKLGRAENPEVEAYIRKLESFIKNSEINKKELMDSQVFGFNKKLIDYYEPKTLQEIVKARQFFKLNTPKTPSEYLVLSGLLHILHGNRPYALSRRSHGITPFAPSGDFIYKPLVKHLREKIGRSLTEASKDDFVEGEMLHQDATSWWPRHIDNLNAIITSPPFFDSTRFYLANWIRLWFSGWDPDDFNKRPLGFVDEKQKIDFNVYEPILRQSRERLAKDGVLVFHLGKSRKCDMAEKLSEVSKRWFKTIDIFEESVEDGESHGIRDKGAVVKHQFLVLQ